MKYEKISSKHNPKVGRWKSLMKDRSLRKREGAVLIEGKNMIQDLVVSKPSSIRCLILREDVSLPHSDLSCPVYLLPNDLFRLISTVESPEGIIAECALPQSSIDLQDLFHCCHRILILDRLQDPGNVGTLLRTAVAFEVDAVLFIEPSCDPWNPKAIRSGKGAHFHIEIVSSSWEELAPFFTERNRSHELFATYPPGRGVIALPKVAAQEKEKYAQGSSPSWAIVLGNEAQGISIPATIPHTRITIPMNCNAESLNVAQAGAICLYTLYSLTL